MKELIMGKGKGEVIIGVKMEREEGRWRVEMVMDGDRGWRGIEYEEGEESKKIG
jgi:hypothetical protein